MVDARRGSSAHATALGKVLLAALSRRSRALSETGVAPSRKTIVERETLLREIDEARRGLVDDGEFDSEARCVAVPVRDFTAASPELSACPADVAAFAAALQDNRNVREAAVECGGTGSAGAGAGASSPSYDLSEIRQRSVG